MRILLIKTSSLGDLIHSFPALSELSQHLGRLRIDWVVERRFAEVPAWHPTIRDVIPVDLRHWLRHPFSLETYRAWKVFVERLQRYEYDVVIDAQGLIKSALITRKARGSTYGLDWHSAWEPLATLVYDKRLPVDPKLHAVHRVQSLFGRIFDYVPNFELPEFGVDVATLNRTVSLPSVPYVVFAHATTWESKKWPIVYWQTLAARLGSEGVKVMLPWGNAAEKQVAEQIAQSQPLVEVLPSMTLTDLAALMGHAQGVVAVDTGLGHIASALNVPLVSLYGATDPQQTGTLGPKSHVMMAEFSCAPCEKSVCQYKGASSVQPACFETLHPDQVWAQLQTWINKDRHHETVNNHHDVQPA